MRFLNGRVSDLPWSYQSDPAGFDREALAAANKR